MIKIEWLIDLKRTERRNKNHDRAILMETIEKVLVVLSLIVLSMVITIAYKGG